MRLVERVRSECDHVLKYGLCSCSRYAVSGAARYLNIALFIRLAVDEVLLLFKHHLHFLFAHRAAHQIGAAERIAAEVTHYLHYLLLIDKAAVSDAQDRLEVRIYVFHVVRMLLVVYVFRDRVHRTRSVKRYSRDYVLKAAWPEVLHEVGHSAALQLEHSLCISVRDELIYFRIVEIHGRKVNIYAMIRFYHAERVTYDSEVPESQEIHLEQSELLYGRHVELRRNALVGRI